MSRSSSAPVLTAASPRTRRSWTHFLPLLLLAGLFCLKVVHAEAASGRRVGFSLDDGATGVSLREIVPGYPAERAGLRDGDRLLEIAGPALTRWALKRAHELAPPEGR